MIQVHKLISHTFFYCIINIYYFMIYFKLTKGKKYLLLNLNTKSI